MEIQKMLLTNSSNIVGGIIVKIVFASDSFKGTLSSKEIMEVLDRKAKQVFPGVQTVGVPIADGGEGTIDAVRSVVGGEVRTVQVRNPLGEIIESQYLLMGENGALIEMAKASGITLIPYKEGNALITTSYGTGELIKDALDNGVRNITISIGGSATNDGGIGMLSALGFSFFDKNGILLDPIGKNLHRIYKIDDKNSHPAIKETKFHVMCDVDNPLLGPNGATYVFGPQKGATKEQIEQLEKGMRNYADQIKRFFGYDVADVKGAGAAGGLGAALMSFCQAKLQSGIRTILELIHFDEIIEDAVLIITGEGRVDGQSSRGKVLEGIGSAAKNKHIPVVAITGGIGSGADTIYSVGIDSIMVTEDGPMTLKEALQNAHSLVEDAAERMFRMIKVGQNLCTKR